MYFYDIVMDGAANRSTLHVSIHDLFPLLLLCGANSVGQM